MSSNPVNVNDVKNLINSAVSQGEVDNDAGQIMINSLNDTNILSCTGVGVDELSTDVVNLISIRLDASFSMSPNEQVVRDAYDELVIKAMRESKQHKSMLVCSGVFDDDVRPLYGFKKVDDIGKIGSQYLARGGSTSLYDAAIEAMTSTRAYAKPLNDSGVHTKCVVIILTDGGNNNGTMDPDRVKKVADDCMKSEMFYLVYVGFNQGPSDKTMHEAAAKAIGFPNVLTTDNSASEVRKAMGLVSQSAIRASQTQIGPTNSFFI